MQKGRERERQREKEETAVLLEEKETDWGAEKGEGDELVNMKREGRGQLKVEWKVWKLYRFFSNYRERHLRHYF